MCEMNLRLVVWIDGELPASEAAAVEQHVQVCGECRGRVAEYQEVSRGFAASYGIPLGPVAATKPRRVARWVPLAVATAAVLAVAALLLFPRAERHTGVAPQTATVTFLPVAKGAAEPDNSARPAPRVAERRTVPHRHPQREEVAMGGPAIQIVLPADSMFPPGAVPEGFAYTANVSFAADGSIQGFRLRP